MKMFVIDTRDGLKIIIKYRVQSFGAISQLSIYLSKYQLRKFARYAENIEIIC